MTFRVRPRRSPRIPVSTLPEAVQLRFPTAKPDTPAGQRGPADTKERTMKAHPARYLVLAVMALLVASSVPAHGVQTSNTTTPLGQVLYLSDSAQPQDGVSYLFRVIAEPLTGHADLIPLANGTLSLNQVDAIACTPDGSKIYFVDKYSPQIASNGDYQGTGTLGYYDVATGTATPSACCQDTSGATSCQASCWRAFRPGDAVRRQRGHGRHLHGEPRHGRCHPARASVVNSGQRDGRPRGRRRPGVLRRRHRLHLDQHGQRHGRALGPLPARTVHSRRDPSPALRRLHARRLLHRRSPSRPTATATSPDPPTTATSTPRASRPPPTTAAAPPDVPRRHALRLQLRRHVQRRRWAPCAPGPSATTRTTTGTGTPVPGVHDDLRHRHHPERRRTAPSPARTSSTASATRPSPTAPTSRCSSRSSSRRSSTSATPTGSRSSPRPRTGCATRASSSSGSIDFHMAFTDRHQAEMANYYASLLDTFNNKYETCQAINSCTPHLRRNGHH